MAGNGGINERYDALQRAFLDRAGVTLGKMLKSQALQVNGKSFAYLSDDSLVLKLPRDAVDELGSELT